MYKLQLLSWYRQILPSLELLTYPIPGMAPVQGDVKKTLRI